MESYEECSFDLANGWSPKGYAYSTTIHARIHCDDEHYLPYTEPLQNPMECHRLPSAELLQALCNVITYPIHTLCKGFILILH